MTAIMNPAGGFTIMIPTIAEVVSQFKREWTQWLTPESIEEVCKEVGLSWRKRVLDPARTVQLFLLQVLHGNTAISHLPHLSRLRFCSAAYCKARMRLPLIVFESLLEKMRDNLQEEDFGTGTWHGHRVFLADGTGVSMPDTPELKSYFDYPHRQRKECSFPVAKLLAMIHLGSGMVSKVIISRHGTHDLSGTDGLHPELRAGDVFVGDRAFCAYHHFTQLLQYGLHAVTRIHSRIAVDFTPGRAHVHPDDIPTDLGQPKSRWIAGLGKKDQVVEWFKPKSKPKRMTREEFDGLPDSLTVRELEYRITQKGFRTKKVTLVTTLTDGKRYSAKALAELYRLRWEVENAFDHLKTTMKMDILRSKTVNGIKKELCAYFIIYNLVRLVMLKAARKQKVKPYRISFVDALRWLATAAPGQPLTTLILVPVRPGRFEPRNKKRREKPYPYMIQPRQELRKKKLSQILER